MISAGDSVSQCVRREKEPYVLIGNIYVDEIGAHIVVVWVHDINFVDKIALFEPKHAAWIGEVQSTVLMVEIPQRRQLELARTYHHWGAVRAGCGCREKGACHGEHAAVGEDGVGPEDDFADARHEGVDRGIGNEKRGDAGGG